MIYRAIGIMSGSSLDGLDIAFTEFTETGGKWTFEIIAADCNEYTEEWQEKLINAPFLPALEYQLLHTDYGHYIGEEINKFIEAHTLQHKVHLVASHGHTSFHLPEKRMTAQLGDGAAIAAQTKLPVVSDLRALDIAFGGQGAPIVPAGERLLFEGYNYFLNLGGIANISVMSTGKYIAFDVCPANRVLNMLAKEKGEKYDDEGKMAAAGKINEPLLNRLNTLEYYGKRYPKSLANGFGTDIVYPMIKDAALSTEDSLRTVTEHICNQIANSVCKARPDDGQQITDHGEKLLVISDQLSAIGHKTPGIQQKILITGGGALNSFLIERLSALLSETNIQVMIPDKKLILYKEAVIMGLIGVLRWREEANVLSSVTGASLDSVGGALWLG